MTVCIFCDNDFVAGGQGEHIIPDNIGGTITIPDVCTTCNAKMNTLYDNKFTQEESIKMARCAYEIKSRKRDEAKCFLDKPGELNGNKVILHQSGKPIVMSKFSLEPIEGGGFAINGVIDKSNISDALKYIDRNAKKMLTSLHPQDTDKQIDEKVESLKQQTIEFCNNEDNVKTSNESILYKFKVDLNVVKKEFCKIAYEFGFYKLGYRYLSDPIALRLRKCLTSNSMFDSIKTEIPCGLRFRTSPDKHYVAIVDQCCIISIFGISGVVPVSSEPSNFVGVQDAMMIIFDPKAGSNSEVRFRDFVRASTCTEEV